MTQRTAMPLREAIMLRELREAATMRNVLFAVAAVLFGVALWFGFQTPKWHHVYNGVHMGPDAISGPTAGGFAVAGGLAVLAGAVVHCFDRPRP